MGISSSRRISVRSTRPCSPTGSTPIRSPYWETSITRRCRSCEASLFPVPVELKRGPVPGLGEVGRVNHVDLRRAQRLVLRLTRLQVRVEPLHQLARRLVLDLPEGGEHGAGAGVLEGAGEPDQPLAAHLLAEPGLAGGEGDEIGVDA